MPRGDGDTGTAQGTSQGGCGLGCPLRHQEMSPVQQGALMMLHAVSPQLDPENTGFIGVETFASLVHSHELPLDPAKLDMLVALAQGNDEGQVCYQELVDLVSAGRPQGRGGCQPGVGTGHLPVPLGRGAHTCSPQGLTWGGMGARPGCGMEGWPGMGWPQTTRPELSPRPPWARPLSADQQQTLQQLQTRHRQRAAGAAPRRPAGRDRPRHLQTLRPLRGL